MTESARWVIIETQANQPFIFATSKQRLQLAASDAIRALGTQWVPEAIGQARRGDQCRHVVKASGLALILVPDQQTGREIIQAVTTRALTSGGGMKVRGVIGPDPVQWDGGAHYRNVTAPLAAAWREFHRTANDGPSPSLRWPSLPFTAQCVFTGRPAVRMSLVGDGRGAKSPISQSVADLCDWPMSARDQLRNRLSAPPADGRPGRRPGTALDRSGDSHE